MKILKKIAPIIILALSINLSTNAQCKSFTKDVCMPKLAPYVYNGQLNNAVLSEGDIAELMLVFYKGQDYRIVVCGEKQLGKINFKLKDANGKTVFTNTDHNMINHWDFNIKSTQQLTVEVSVPQTSKDKNYKSGCVSILVGFLSKE
jgi:hypothetical protein